MRLKGGKLFIEKTDLDSYVEDWDITLSDEEMNCVLSKGLVLLLKYAGKKFVINCSWDAISVENDELYTLQHFIYAPNGDLLAILVLRLSNNVFEFITI